MVEVPRSPLLRLPGELRKMIYKRALCPDAVHLVLKEPKDFQIISHVPTVEEPQLRRQFDPSLRVAGNQKMVRTLEVLQRESRVETINHLKTNDVSNALLLVCKLFYDEAVPVLYSENIFCVYAELLPFVYGMLAAIGSVNATAIRFLHIYYFGAPLVDLSYELMIPRNPVMKLCHRLQGLQEVKVWRPQENLDDDYRDQNIADSHIESMKQSSRAMAARIFVSALQGVRSSKSAGSQSGTILVEREHRYARWVKNGVDLQRNPGVSNCLLRIGL